MLDVSHSAQTGLTIRTIETIGARRKLITTNTEVVKYALYDPSRVLTALVGGSFVAQPRDHPGREFRCGQVLAGDAADLVHAGRANAHLHAGVDYARLQAVGGDAARSVLESLIR